MAVKIAIQSETMMLLAISTAEECWRAGNAADIRQCCC